MMMKSKSNPLVEDMIDDLVDDLEPVAPLRFGRGAILVGVAVLASIMLVALVKSLGFTEANPLSPLFSFTGGVGFFAVGAVIAASALLLANPAVGAPRANPIIWLALVLALPAFALLMTLVTGKQMDSLIDPYAITCMVSGVLTSLVSLAVLVLWLRRGAPMAPDRAGMLAGMAAGALGTAAYGLTCPIDTLNHIGIWHAMPIIIGAIVGRFAIAPLLKW